MDDSLSLSRMGRRGRERAGQADGSDGEWRLMVELSAEQFAQRAFDLNLIDERQLQELWGQIGTRQLSGEQFQQLLAPRAIDELSDRAVAARRSHRVFLRQLQSAVSDRHGHVCPRVSGLPQVDRRDRRPEGAAPPVCRRRRAGRPLLPRRQDGRHAWCIPTSCPSWKSSPRGTCTTW